MTTQPKFHWKFQDKPGATTTVDSISKVRAKLSEANPSGHGRIGRGMHLLEKKSHVNLGKAVGQFGTGDFTIAFGMKNISNHGDGELDIIGSQTMKGHGNFFSVRLSGKDRIFFHVDENSKGKHYVKAQTDPLSMVSNRTWFHVAVVRKGPTIQIYINGVLSIEEKSKTGVANIKNDTDVKLGHSRRHTPNAQYEDLRIYDRALDAEEIQDLIPSANRPLREGEIELIAADGAAIILRGDVGHLSRFSREFQTLRVGPDTRVSLFNKASFSGTGQRIYADLPDIRLSRLEDFPASVRIRSAIGEPFTGKWLIKAPNGQFLTRIQLPVPFNKAKQLSNKMLMTSPKRSFNALFRLHQHRQPSRIQIVPDSVEKDTRFKLSIKTNAASTLFVEELRPLIGEFAIVNQANNQWLQMGKNNTLNWTTQKEKRAVFTRVAKMADNESQVGELAPGEVALYQHRAYYGRTWILSDTVRDLSGNYPRMSAFEGLDDQTSSIRLGPETGATVFKLPEFRGSLKGKPFVRQRFPFRGRLPVKRDGLIEDILEAVPHLKDRQIGNDTVSSLQIFRTVEPEDVFDAYTTKLSQDYKMVGDKLEEFSAYRTILRFKPSAAKVKVEVSATDLTKIEVAGTTHSIDEARSVVLTPNEMNLIMITSEADGINTPGLKIRTNAMALNERVVIFPNKEAHQQIAALEDGALWNAKDAQGNSVVDQKAHSKEEVASVQNTIKRMMTTVAYSEEAPTQAKSSVATGRSASVRTALPKNKRPRVRSSNKAVSGATIDKPWKLEFKPANGNSQRLSARAGARTGARAVTKSASSGVNDSQFLSASASETLIQEVEVSQDEFAQLLSQSIPEETTSAQLPVNTLPGQAKSIRISNPFKKIKDAVKSGFSTVIGIANGVINVLVDTAQGVFKFIVDTVEKVAEFVEAVVEKVVKSIKQFIEFLQFLFDWGDILKTQRYLVGAVNAGFDYAAQLADDAKPHVSSFISDLQGTVKDGMDTLVEKLGGEPSEVKESKVEMPEALDWLLSKMLGGSKQTKDDSGSERVPSGDSPLEAFMRHFLEAFEDVASSGLRGLEGVSESILTLLKDPLKPERALVVILEALRDVIIQLLNGVENIALGLLEVVGAALDLIKTVLNREIKIPFISDLFKLIGAGKLTILNLSTILLAVPVTVVHKIAFNERPFKDLAPLDISNKKISTQTDAGFAAVSQRASKATQRENPEETARENSEEESTKASKRAERLTTGLGTVSLIANFMNGLLNGYLDVIPEAFDDPREVSFFDGAVEAMTWINDLFIWLPSIPGLITEGAARFTAVSVEERVLWVYRTFTLALDLGVMAVGWTPLAGGLNTQRMRRANEITIVGSSILGAIDFVLGAVLVGNTIKKEEQALHFVHQMLFPLPRILGVLRLDSSGVGGLVLILVDVVTAAVTTATGFVVLGNNFDGIKAAVIPQG